MRRTLHRRRFHTDRIVANRRARYLREWPAARQEVQEWPSLAKRLSYGALASTDPWDCGRSACGICHTPEVGRRTREKRQWRRDWEGEGSAPVEG